jgi:hypothetical protein
VLQGVIDYLSEELGGCHIIHIDLVDDLNKEDTLFQSGIRSLMNKMSESCGTNQRRLVQTHSEEGKAVAGRLIALCPKDW